MTHEEHTSAQIHRTPTMTSHKQVRRGLVLAAIAVAFGGVPTMGQAADVTLDSRTIPHADWVQLSGQIEDSSVISDERGDRLWAILRPSEGGRVAIDFGPTGGTGGFHAKRDDFIHVRGKAIEKDGNVTIIAKEVFAEGHIFSLKRNDAIAAERDEAIGMSGLESFEPSPAAPPPR